MKIKFLAGLLGLALMQSQLCWVTWNGTGTLTGILKAVAGTASVVISSSVGTDTAVVNYLCYGNPF